MSAASITLIDLKVCVGGDVPCTLDTKEAKPLICMTGFA